MKTLMNMMLALLLLVANTTVAQAINYPTYNSSIQVVYSGVNPSQPAVSSGLFQTNDLTPLINNQTGHAVQPYAAAPGRPRRAEGDHVGSGCPEHSGGAHVDDGTGHCGYCGVKLADLNPNVGTPDDPDKDKQIPIGSVLILLLLALCHVAYIAYSTSARKQK